jgi:hypothetical protein
VDLVTIEIIIDPNVRVAGNRTYGGFEDVLGGFVGDLSPGDPVTVLEEESGVIGEATVYEINYEKQLVYLEVDWASLRPRPGQSNRMVASVVAIIRTHITSQPDEANLGEGLTSTTSGGLYATAG